MIILIDNSGVLIHYASGFQKSNDQYYRRYGGLLSFFRLLKRLLLEYPEAKLITFGDKCKKQNFRNQIDQTYKDTRSPLSDVIIQQLCDLDAYLNNYMIPYIHHLEYEADDLIASFINSNPSEQFIIVSRDKDFSQLVNNNVSIYNSFYKSLPTESTISQNLVNKDMVLQKYGVTPCQFILYQALMGDASDNVRGIKGIGPVTASSMINKNNGDIISIQQEYGQKYNFQDIDKYIQLVTLYKHIDMSKYSQYTVVTLDTINQIINNIINNKI